MGRLLHNICPMVNVKILACQTDMLWLFYKDTTVGVLTISLVTPRRCLIVTRTVQDILLKNVLARDTMATLS